VNIRLSSTTGEKRLFVPILSKKCPDGLGRGLAKEEEPLSVVLFFHFSAECEGY